jgi:hypothetical protein
MLSLAKANVKVLHLHGDEHTLVPAGANSEELARRYRELGGQAETVLLKGLGAERPESRSGGVLDARRPTRVPDVGRRERGRGREGNSKEPE